MSLVILIVVLIFIFILLILTNNQKIQTIKSFLQVDNKASLFYEGSLYWTNFYLNNQSFTMLVDTGSNLVSVGDSNCQNCQQGARLNAISNNLRTASYGGGQNVNYTSQLAFANQLNKNIEVAIVKSGNNPNGQILNILGLMNPSLGLSSLTIDFPGKFIAFNPNINPTNNGKELLNLPYLAIQITGIQNVDKIILDTGTNYVLTTQNYPSGFNFNIGDKNIVVDGSVIRQNNNSDLPNSIVIGNMVMSKYRWDIDFINRKIYVY